MRGADARLGLLSSSVSSLSIKSLLLLFFSSCALCLPGGEAKADDAGAPENTYGCVERIPKGAQKPIVLDWFPTRGTSGWAATLSIAVRHGKGERVLPAGLDLESAGEAKKYLKQAGFAIPDQSGGTAAKIWVEPEDPARPWTTTHLDLPLVPLPDKPGRQGMILPPLPVAVARANGEIATLCTNPHPILVEDPIANVPEALPKTNPPPLVQREEWTSLKKGLLWGSIGLVLGALFFWLAYRKVTAPKPPPPPPPPRPPWEVALEKLDEVRHAGLLDVRRYGDYFDRVSDAVRGYLGARFGFDGLESTTDEILVRLRTQGAGFVSVEKVEGADALPAPGVPLDEIARFLRDCDLVKFANLTPTPEQCATSIEVGERIVRKTMPIASQPPPPPPAEGGAA